MSTKTTSDKNVYDRKSKTNFVDLFVEINFPEEIKRNETSLFLVYRVLTKHNLQLFSKLCDIKRSKNVCEISFLNSSVQYLFRFLHYQVNVFSIGFRSRRSTLLYRN